MEYGSLINHVLANADELQPKLGMHCTELCWSDRHPYRVVEVICDKKGIVKQAIVQAMKVEADKSKVPRMGHQDWIITENPNGVKQIIKFRNTKRHTGWYAKYESGWGNKFLMGVAEEYYDWSF